MRGLTSEQEELLRDLMQSDTWEALLALAEIGANRQAEAVLKYDLNKGSRELVILKARLEGALTLIKALESAKRDFKIK